MDIFLDDFSFLFLKKKMLIYLPTFERPLANLQKFVIWIGVFVAALLHKLAGPFLFFVRTAVIGHECNFVFYCKCELWKYHIFNATGDDMTLKMQRGHFDSFRSLSFKCQMWWPIWNPPNKNNQQQTQALNDNYNYRHSLMKQWYRFWVYYYRYYY